MEVDVKGEVAESRDGYLIATEKWIEDEMWNQRDRRPPDLHDLAAFARAYREGERDGYRRRAREEISKSAG
jgi:hypothetical protein